MKPRRLSRERLHSNGQHLTVKCQTAVKTLGSGCNIVGPLLHVKEVPGGAKTKEPEALGQETLGKTPDLYLHVLHGI
jgi:hypothetical protein